MEQRSDYRYDAYNTSAIRAVRLPQQTWAGGAPDLGASGLPVVEGRITWFDRDAGIGEIRATGDEESIFFHFTAIPGEGYRTIRPGTTVRFERVDSPRGPTARNIQPKEE